MKITMLASVKGQINGDVIDFTCGTTYTVGEGINGRLANAFVRDGYAVAVAQDVKSATGKAKKFQSKQEYE